MISLKLFTIKYYFCYTLILPQGFVEINDVAKHLLYENWLPVYMKMCYVHVKQNGAEIRFGDLRGSSQPNPRFRIGDHYKQKLTRNPAAITAISGRLCFLLYVAHL